MLFNCGVGEDPGGPLNCKIKPVNPKGNQSWMFIGRTDTKAEALILWPPDAKNWLVSKDPDARKGWRQEDKGMTEDEMIGWDHRLDGHEFEQAPVVGDGQGNLVCCSPWDHKESDMTERMNWTELHYPCPLKDSHVLQTLQRVFLYFCSVKQECFLCIKF